MGLVYACPSCRGRMLLRPQHRGHGIPCPACGATVDVPGGLMFRRLTKASIEDRNSARWGLVWSFLACAVWLPPVTAFIWWRMAGRIRRAHEEGRDVVEDVRTARMVAIVGFAAQMTFYAKFALNRF